MDGDGTLLKNNRLESATARALENLRAANILLLLVTGESREELRKFPRVDLFHQIVAEDGAVLIDPSLDKATQLVDSPPPEFVQALREEGVEPLRAGRVIVQSKVPCEKAVMDIVHRFNMDWNTVRNRDDLLVLPRGVNKASGLSAVLKEIEVSPKQVAAIGDAQNDRSMLEFCGLGVAVGNAVPELKQIAKMTTRGHCGQGVIELAEHVLGSA
jgi:hydroxymethylpyrimidine pyrophosphatase-like HAD family hydrolase